MNILKTIIGIFVFATAMVFAQFEDPVSLSAIADGSVRAGEIIDVKVALSMERGWHIYGMEKIQDGPIPTTINITAPEKNPTNKRCL